MGDYRFGAGNRWGSRDRTLREKTATNKKPGWLARLLLTSRRNHSGRFFKTSNLQNFDLKTTIPNSSGCDNILSPARHITSARLSSSFCSTGIEQPDISTRPAASMAACGETP